MFSYHGFLIMLKKILKKVLTNYIPLWYYVYVPLRYTTKTERILQMRKEMYEELIQLGFTPEEAWEQISEMDFAEDYED